jgi:hypothetical protein
MKSSILASVLLTAGALVAGSDLAFSQIILNAHAGPANNGLSSGNAAMFFDVTASTPGVTITEMTTAATAAAGAAFTVEVFVFNGSGLGGPVGSGPGSSPTGWTSLGTAPATQGATTNGISLPIDIPDIVLTQGQVTGVAIRWVSTGGPRYLGTGAPPLSVFSDANLSLTTGDARSAPFTTGGSWFSSRALVGSLTYTAGSGPVPPVAYCFGDGTGTACPCGNVGSVGNGCANSTNANGAGLAASGAASISADTLVLTASGMPNVSSCRFIQGTTQVAGGLGAPFGDGLDCLGGTLVRLGTKLASGGVASYPAVGEPLISVKGMCAAGDVRNYQVIYRDAAPYCTTDVFNLTSGMNVTWTP